MHALLLFYSCEIGGFVRDILELLAGGVSLDAVILGILLSHGYSHPCSWLCVVIVHMQDVLQCIYLYI